MTTVDHDLLLRWCSERSSGSLLAFRQAHHWLQDQDLAPSVTSAASGASEHEAAGGRDHWTWALRSLQTLGHVEVDWLGRRWHVAPPVVTTLTDGGGFALLCGARPAALLRRLDGLADDPDPRLRDLAADVLFDLPIPQSEGPALRLLQAPDLDAARELCGLLGIELVDRAADRLLRVLPPLNQLLLPGARQDLPGGVAPARMTQWPDRSLFAELDYDRSEPGAYEVRLYEAPRYFFRYSPDRVFEAERGAVVYAELRRTDRHVLRYNPDSQALLVPPRLRLPSLYERAATLRSGLLPQLTKLAQPASGASGRTQSLLLLRYVNIDLPFAQRLAALLGQQLHLLPAPQSPQPAAAPAPAWPRPAPGRGSPPSPVLRPTLERR